MSISNLFTTDEFAFKDIKIMIQGQSIARLQGVKFKTSVEKEALYGTGDKPLAIQSGNVAFEGEVKMLQSEFRTLSLAMGGNVLTGGYTDIVVVFAKNTGGIIETHTITGVQFTETELGLEQGDKNMEITLPFMALNIINA